MIERGGRPRFAAKSLPRLHIARQIGGEEIQRDVASEATVASTINVSPGTGAETGHHLERSADACHHPRPPRLHHCAGPRSATRAPRERSPRRVAAPKGG